MSRKQLVFDISSPSVEEQSDPHMMDCLNSNNDFIPVGLTFDDEDSRDSGFECQGSDNEISPSTIALRRFTSHVEIRNNGTRRSLFSGKRSRDDDMPLRGKKPRLSLITQSRLTIETEVTSDTMKLAVEKMDMEADLIGDGSLTHLLPTVSGRHKDLKSVSSHTVSQLLKGQYDDVISGFKIIDCRYPYEYEGGHIEGALNLHTEAMITDLITRPHDSESTSRNILIFHCEFSSERGPKLLRHLRSMDRKLNSDRYPFLFYPEEYLLDGGYKAFYQQHQVQCDPRNYVPMLHENFSKELRHFRVKSKSWTAGEKQKMRNQRFLMDVSPMKLLL